MKEIGGYLELEQNHGSLLHDNAVALNCGRAALEYLIRAKNMKKLYLPYFCCDSLIQPCKRCGIPYEHYHVDTAFRPAFRGCLGPDEWLYLVNYYGQISNDDIAGYQEKYGRVIVDNSQAYFQLPDRGVDTIYSCRKFFGVPDGAFLHTDTYLEGLTRDESFERMRYLLGRFERTANEFYAESAENNRRFDDQPMKRMSKLTENLLRGIDYDLVRKKRTDNFKYLHEKLGTRNRLHLTVPDGAFMYPFYCENGAAVRKKLIAQQIYIPVLWPDVMTLTGCDGEQDMAQNILPLPVDQRYGAEEMERVTRALDEGRRDKEGFTYG